VDPEHVAELILKGSNEQHDCPTPLMLRAPLKYIFHARGDQPG
jgi:hypothetical protein